MQNPQSPLLFLPTIVGGAATTGTVLVHALLIKEAIRFVRHRKVSGQFGTDFLRDMRLIMRVMLYAFTAHLLEIGLWAALFMTCGEFADFATAYYHSSVNYTSLGYGDIIMSNKWRMLAPLETADGMLLFGVSTAVVFAIIHRLVETRYAELKD